MGNNFSHDIDLMSKELRLLLEILKRDVVSIQLIKSELLNEIDWDQFLNLVWHHRVYSIIYFKLKKVDEKLFPPQVIQALYQEYKKNTLRMLFLSAEMEKVGKLFADNKIPLLFLKGPVIAADLFGDISLRTSRDLDVLIPIKNLEYAEKLLLNFGYEREGEVGVLNEWKWRDYHVSYYHPQRDIHIEVHWRLQRRPSKEPNFFDLWERKRLSLATSYPVYFLGKEDLFLYLVSHGARHGWFRLRWLLDIDKILRKGINIEKNNLLMKDYQNHHIVGQATILSSQLLNTPINNGMQVLANRKRSKKLAQQALYFIKGTETLEIIMSTKNYKRYLFSLKSHLQRFLFLLISFYPGKADLKTLMLPKYLHVLYFPLRPLLKTWRLIRKSVQERM